MLFDWCECWNVCVCMAENCKLYHILDHSGKYNIYSIYLYNVYLCVYICIWYMCIHMVTCSFGYYIQLHLTSFNFKLIHNYRQHLTYDESI